MKLFWKYKHKYLIFVSGTDDWEYQWEDEEVTEDIRIPTSSFNGDLDYDDEDEESAKSSLANGGVMQVHQFTNLTTCYFNSR